MDQVQRSKCRVQRYTTKSKAQESGSEASGHRVTYNSKGTGTESVGLCPETRECQGKRVARVAGAEQVWNGYIQPGNR